MTGVVVGGSYDLDDMDGAWSQGKAIADLCTDAREYGNKLINAVDNCDVGSHLAGGSLEGKLDEARQHLQRGSTDLADEVERLGNNIMNGAKEAAETQNDGTQVANAQIMRLSRTVNEVLPW